MKPTNEKIKTIKVRNPIVLYILALTLVFASCNKDEEKVEEEITGDGQQSKLEKKYFLGEEVFVLKQDDGAYRLGNDDILFFPEQLSNQPQIMNKNPLPDNGKTKLGQGSSLNKWIDNTVYYVVKGLSKAVRNELEKAMKEWSSKTNIRFKKRTVEPNYVTISSSGKNENVGVATLGMRGNKGTIRLGTKATYPLIVHEIGHTLGFIHEHNRPDRDNFVLINYKNIKSKFYRAFTKASKSIKLTDKFDLYSIMIYNSYTFSKNGKKTITDLNGKVLPYKKGLSLLDIAGANTAYPASNKKSCKNVKEFSSGTSYKVGDHVIYMGYLYEKDFVNWIFIKGCK